MLFGQQSYYYRDCDANLCTKCQFSHKANHAEFMICITTIAWNPKMKLTKPRTSCSQCSREVNCRTECSDCLQCHCMLCNYYQDRRTTWNERHQESCSGKKKFRVLVSPYRFVKPPSDRHCECLEGCGSVSHCRRCLAGTPYESISPISSQISPCPRVGVIHLALM